MPVVTNSFVNSVATHAIISQFFWDSFQQRCNPAKLKRGSVPFIHAVVFVCQHHYVVPLTIKTSSIASLLKFDKICSGSGNTCLLLFSWSIAKANILLVYLLTTIPFSLYLHMVSLPPAVYVKNILIFCYIFQ